jgi:hypothetical protein
MRRARAVPDTTSVFGIICRNKRNDRLRDGGVFEYVMELTNAHGWEAI